MATTSEDYVVVQEDAEKRSRAWWQESGRKPTTAHFGHYYRVEYLCRISVTREWVGPSQTAVPGSGANSTRKTMGERLEHPSSP